ALPALAAKPPPQKPPGQVGRPHKPAPRSRSPRTAKNNSPRPTVRESMEHPPATTVPACATLAGASSTAPAPIAASASVSFIALHGNPNRPARKEQLPHHRKELR